MYKGTILLVLRVLVSVVLYAIAICMMGAVLFEYGVPWTINLLLVGLTSILAGGHLAKRVYQYERKRGDY